eukprot:2740898-Prymnesium_polylepis.1
MRYRDRIAATTQSGSLTRTPRPKYPKRAATYVRYMCLRAARSSSKVASNPNAEHWPTSPSPTSSSQHMQRADRVTEFCGSTELWSSSTPSRRGGENAERADG